MEGLARFEKGRGDTDGKGKKAPLSRQVLLRQEGPPGEPRQNLDKKRFTGPSKPFEPIN